MSDQQPGEVQPEIPRDAAVAKARAKPPGGKRRGRAEVDRLMKKMETAMLYSPSWPDLVEMMKEERLPFRTLEDYARRIRERWLAEDIDDRPRTRARQKRRLISQIRTLTASQDPNDRRQAHREIIKRERLLAQIEGNLAPLQIDVYERSAVDDLTQEQLQYIADTGKLPPGVTPAMLHKTGKPRG